MPAPQEIIDLVQRFTDNIDAYKSGKYNETQVRREFIDLVQRFTDNIDDYKSGHGKTTLQRRIDTTDAQIDRLVYDLYGLTEDEIKIVEDAAK